MNDKGSSRRIAALIDGKRRVYLMFPSRAGIGVFLRRAGAEGIRFGDGAAAEDRPIRPIMRLLDDGTICYVGFAGTMACHSRDPDILRVDMDRYLAGREDYIVAPKGAGKETDDE